MARPESALQEACKRFCSSVVFDPHIFVAWDRSAARGKYSHLFEAKRGIIAGWPDCAVMTPGLAVFL